VSAEASRMRCPSWHKILVTPLTADFIPPSLWPPNCPDLDHGDCGVGDSAGPRVQEPDQGRGRAREKERDGLDQRVIDSTIRGWRKRLQACVAAD